MSTFTQCLDAYSLPWSVVADVEFGVTSLRVMKVRVPASNDISLTPGDLIYHKTGNLFYSSMPTQSKRTTADR